MGEFMMGPGRIPLVHNRAFGHVALFPMSPTIARRGNRLGEPPGPTIDGSTIDYQKTKDYYEGIRNNYEALVSLIGVDSAKAALEEAKGSYEEALKAWTASQPTRI